MNVMDSGVVSSWLVRGVRMTPGATAFSAIPAPAQELVMASLRTHWDSARFPDDPIMVWVAGFDVSSSARRRAPGSSPARSRSTRPG